MLGANTAIFKDGQVLLMKREDFEVWCLPGGMMETGEAPAETAIREAKEETGLDVRLTRLVGVYSRPKWRGGDYHIFLFAAEIMGGELTPQPEEALELRFFPLDALPADMMIGQRERTLDAFSGLSGIAKAEYPTWNFDPQLTRWDIYRMRDESGLSRLEFYQRHHVDLTPDQIVTYVAGYKAVLSAED